MKSTRRRRSLGLVTTVLGISAVVVAVSALAKPVLEMWYIRQLESGDTEVSRGAAIRLGELRSARAIPQLLVMLERECRQQEPTQTSQRGATRQKAPSVAYQIATWRPADLPTSAQALVAIGAPAAPRLVETLEGAAELVRMTAAVTLADIGPSAFSALTEGLDHPDRKVRQLSAAALGVRGRVVDHEGRPVAGASVFLAGGREQNILNGQVTRYIDWPIRNSAKISSIHQVETDLGGHFVLRGAGEKGNVVVVLTDFLHAWTAPVSDLREEITITLPEPATLVLRYDIDNDLPEAEIHAYLNTWERKDWQLGNIVQIAAVVNGSEMVLKNVTPGDYQLSRRKSFRLGDYGTGRPLERRSVTLAAGKTTEVEFVRREGAVITGRVTGLPDGAVPGVFLHLEPANKTEDNRRLVLELLTCEPNGEFTTARIPPGDYLVVARAYEPEGRTIRSFRRPDFSDSLEVTVPSSGRLEPVVIEMRKGSR